jgi:hypothetical protein
MEEIEISTEQQQEAIHHHAEHSGESWLLWCALISAVLAVAAAVSGLYSSHYANEAMIEQMHASDHWGYYQAKGVKAMLTEMHNDFLQSLGKPESEVLKQKIEGYHKEQQEIKDKATEEGEKSASFLHQHERLAKAVTAFQISIAITAMAAICRRKHFLIFTLLLSIAGTFFMVTAFWG